MPAEHENTHLHSNAATLKKKHKSTFFQGQDGSKGDKGSPGVLGNPGEPGLRGKDVSKC